MLGLSSFLFNELHAFSAHGGGVGPGVYYALIAQYLLILHMEEVASGSLRTESLLPEGVAPASLELTGTMLARVQLSGAMSEVALAALLARPCFQPVLADLCFESALLQIPSFLASGFLSFVGKLLVYFIPLFRITFLVFIRSHGHSDSPHVVIIRRSFLTDRLVSCTRVFM